MAITTVGDIESRTGSFSSGFSQTSVGTSSSQTSDTHGDSWQSSDTSTVNTSGSTSGTFSISAGVQAGSLTASSVATIQLVSSLLHSGDDNDTDNWVGGFTDDSDSTVTLVSSTGSTTSWGQNADGQDFSQENATSAGATALYGRSERTDSYTLTSGQSGGGGLEGSGGGSTGGGSPGGGSPGGGGPGGPGGGDSSSQTRSSRSETIQTASSQSGSIVSSRQTLGSDGQPIAWEEASHDTVTSRSTVTVDAESEWRMTIPVEGNEPIRLETRNFFDHSITNNQSGTSVSSSSWTFGGSAASEWSWTMTSSESTSTDDRTHENETLPGGTFDDLRTIIERKDRHFHHSDVVGDSHGSNGSNGSSFGSSYRFTFSGGNEFNYESKTWVYLVHDEGVGARYEVIGGSSGKNTYRITASYSFDEDGFHYSATMSGTSTWKTYSDILGTPWDSPRTEVNHSSSYSFTLSDSGSSANFSYENDAPPIVPVSIPEPTPAASDSGFLTDAAFFLREFVKVFPEKVAPGERLIGVGVGVGRLWNGWVVQPAIAGYELTGDMFSNPGKTLNEISTGVPILGTAIIGAGIEALANPSATLNSFVVGVDKFLDADPREQAAVVTHWILDAVVSRGLDEARVLALAAKCDPKGNVFDWLASLWIGCFPAGTLVSAEHGPAPIETLAVGDRVWAYDPVELVWSLKPILATVTPHYHGKLITLDLGEERLEVTTSHPFWVVTGDDLVSRPRPAHVDDLSAPSQTTGRWVDSEHLRPGDFLLTKSGTVLRLESVAIRDVAGLPVYNFTVGDLHCYPVTIHELLVHNRNSCLPEGFSSFGEYLTSKIGPPPAWMIDPHAHHILFKKGLGAAQQALVEEGQAYLRKVGIDPIFGIENLVWAPWRIVGQHDIATLTKVVEKLRQLDKIGATYDDFVEALQTLGRAAASRG